MNKPLPCGARANVTAPAHHLVSHALGGCGPRTICDDGHVVVRHFGLYMYISTNYLCIYPRTICVYIHELFVYITICIYPRTICDDGHVVVRHFGLGICV